MSRNRTLCLILLNISQDNMKEFLSLAINSIGFKIKYSVIGLKMVGYQNLAVKLVTLAILALINFAWVSPANAVNRDFQLSSDRGYRLETNFDYELADGKEIAERGKGKTKAIDSLQVRFYNPDGEMIASYDNIVDGIARGEYFEFNYDPNTQQLIGNIDLGGESAGEMYLKGNIEKGLTLIEVESTGEERAMNSGKWRIDPR